MPPHATPCHPMPPHATPLLRAWNRTAPISVSLAFGSHGCASTANATVRGWPSKSTWCFPPTLFPKVLNAKQGSSTGQFSILWYDSTGYRTLITRVQSEDSTTGPQTRSRKVAACLYFQVVTITGYGHYHGLWSLSRVVVTITGCGHIKRKDRATSLYS